MIDVKEQIKIEMILFIISCKYHQPEALVMSRARSLRSVYLALDIANAGGYTPVDAGINAS
jgi:hypothetical protein